MVQTDSVSAVNESKSIRGLPGIKTSVVTGPLEKRESGFPNAFDNVLCGVVRLDFVIVVESCWLGICICLLGLTAS